MIIAELIQALHQATVRRRYACNTLFLATQALPLQPAAVGVASSITSVYGEPAQLFGHGRKNLSSVRPGSTGAHA